MAQFSACCNPCQNPLFDIEDELASRTPIESSNRCTPAPTTTHAPTLAVALIVAPFAAFGSADSFVVRYSEDDLQ